jgi:hypothetical protein
VVPSPGLRAIFLTNNTTIANNTTTTTTGVDPVFLMSLAIVGTILLVILFEYLTRNK